MKIVIWITIQAIWIRLLEKVWMATQQQSDSNPSSTDSNPNSSKGYFDGLIRITIQVIRIPDEEEVKLRATDSNHLYSDSNPSWKTSEEIEAWIRITYTTIWIPKSEVMKNKTRWFESSSYGFKSLHKLKVKAKVQTKRFESLSYGFESLRKLKQKAES